MCEMIIEKGIIVDDVESMIRALNGLTNRYIKDADVIKKFICSEKNTKFYINEKFKTSINADIDSRYLWLDTGFCDTNAHPIFISLLRIGREFVGHYVGTAKMLMEYIKDYFPANKKLIKENYSRFLQKYNSKSKERTTVHIVDEKSYFLSKVNCNIKDEGVMEKKLRILGESWKLEDEQEKTVEETQVVEEKLSNEDVEITIGLLIEKLEELERYNKELLDIITAKTIQSDKTIRALESKNNEYQEAIMKMRLFVVAEQIEELEAIAKNYYTNNEKLGHDLLGGNKQILVIGDTRIGIDNMQGIAKKDYGFKNGDFEFITDYDKIVHAAKRVQNSNRYVAIIFGCCPHKVKNTNWSSIIEQFKNCMDGIIAVDARSKNGKLKVTKESYRNALNIICDSLYISATAVA